MFRFLVVEDYEPTLREIKILLSKEFDGSTIDAAVSVAEGSQYIAASFERGRVYDAALLDFKIPSSSGENPEIDYSLCEEVRRRYPRTLVIHMTSYDQDPAILHHLAESHSEPTSPWPVLIPKKGNWPSALRKRLRTFLFTREIVMQMDEIFGDLPAAEGFGRTAALRRRTARESGVTHRLAVLTQNIEKHWSDLSEPLQERIRATFVVDDTVGDDVRVSLL